MVTVEHAIVLAGGIGSRMLPATALVAELTEDYDERTEMMSFRFFFGF